MKNSPKVSKLIDETRDYLLSLSQQELVSKIESLKNDHYKKLMNDIEKSDPDYETKCIMMIMPDGELRLFSAEELKEYLIQNIAIE